MYFRDSTRAIFQALDARTRRRLFDLFDEIEDRLNGEIPEIAQNVQSFEAVHNFARVRAPGTTERTENLLIESLSARSTEKEEFGSNFE